MCPHGGGYQCQGQRLRILKVKNWLGQEIVPGVVVYRGARDGNYSSYKIGVVESVDPAKSTARVAWKFEPGRVWRKVNGQNEYLRNVPAQMDSKGSPSIDSLIVIDRKLMERLESATYFLRMWKDGSLSNDKIKDTLDSILGS